MIRSSTSFLIVLLFSGFCRGQDINTRTLLTVDGRKTEAGEFIRMYRKNLEPGKAQDVDAYLQQFILFKLKVADAMRQGLDTTRSFTTELNGYRNQLVRSYLTDNTTKEKLLKTAYQRSLTEVNAMHILISLPENASPEDTLRAWQKASAIRQRILNGEQFDRVARSSSDDKSVLLNGGDLGFFTVFQMISPFEDAAYSMKPGQVSQPVRTPYGYHIIKVVAKRPSSGRVRVAHIMKNSPPGTDPAEAEKAEKEINAIYDKLKNGADFGEMARLYSDHRESAVNGGKLDWFGTGEMIGDFSEAAFAIRDTGTYSKPVRTLYGWHIIKLLDRKKPGSYEESKSFIESRINQSWLDAVSRKTFTDRLKKEYKFSIDQNSLNWFILNTDTLVIQGLKKYDRSLMPAGNLYSFANRSTSNSGFADYVEKRGFIIDTKDSAFFVNRTLEIKAADDLISYENTQIEKKNPEFRYLMNEFHDGILLFELSNRNVWNRVSEDSAGLIKYYEKHKMEHLTNPGINATVYTLRIADGGKKLETAYKKYSSKQNARELLDAKFNKRKDTLLVITKRRWFKGDDPVIDSLKWNKGEQYLKINGFPSIISINEIIEPLPLPLRDVKSEMMAAWQDELENTWREQLKKKYSVKLDNMVLAEVKKKLAR